MLLFKFATKIRELMNKGLSQQEAAQKLGVKIQGGGHGSNIRIKPRLK